jgi:predicted phage terminase large subunit-like protein
MPAERAPMRKVREVLRLKHALGVSERQIAVSIGVSRSTGRFPFDALKRKVTEVKQRYGSCTLLIEDCPISRGLIQSLREKSINVTPYKPETDKRARVIAQSDLFAGGSVRFPLRAGWLEEFTAELLAFSGRHDDQVDALTQGLAWGRHMWSRKCSVSFYRI